MKIMLDPGAVQPNRAHDDDAGYDLFSREEKIIMPGESAEFDTGVHMEISRGWFGQLFSKSGLMVKYGVICPGGTIDSGFTGSVHVVLLNIDKKPYMIRKGQKIAQMVIMERKAPEMEVVEELSDSDRGSNGFGSTDKYTRDPVRETLNNNSTMWEDGHER